MLEPNKRACFLGPLGRRHPTIRLTQSQPHPQTPLAAMSSSSMTPDEMRAARLRALGQQQAASPDGGNAAAPAAVGTTSDGMGAPPAATWAAVAGSGGGVVAAAPSGVGAGLTRRPTEEEMAEMRAVRFCCCVMLLFGRFGGGPWAWGWFVFGPVSNPDRSHTHTSYPTTQQSAAVAPDGHGGRSGALAPAGVRAAGGAALWARAGARGCV
jgi:hypothetical protein